MSKSLNKKTRNVWICCGSFYLNFSNCSSHSGQIILPKNFIQVAVFFGVQAFIKLNYMADLPEKDRVTRPADALAETGNPPPFRVPLICEFVLLPEKLFNC